MTIEEHYAVIAPRLTNWLVATGSSYHDACDLVQAVFLKLWKMQGDLRDNDSAVTGLAFTMAKNLRKNAVRDDSRLTFKEEITDEDGGAAQAAVMPSDAAYLRRRLNEAFAKLPPTCERRLHFSRSANSQFAKSRTSLGSAKGLSRSGFTAQRKNFAKSSPTL